MDPHPVKFVLVALATTIPYVSSSPSKKNAFLKFMLVVGLTHGIDKRASLFLIDILKHQLKIPLVSQQSTSKTIDH